MSKRIDVKIEAHISVEIPKEDFENKYDGSKNYVAYDMVMDLFEGSSCNLNSIRFMGVEEQ